MVNLHNQTDLMPPSQANPNQVCILVMPVLFLQDIQVKINQERTRDTLVPRTLLHMVNTLRQMALILQCKVKRSQERIPAMLVLLLQVIQGKINLILWHLLPPDTVLRHMVNLLWGSPMEIMQFYHPQKYKKT
jgi:hypothetical protein